MAIWLLVAIVVAASSTQAMVPAPIVDGGAFLEVGSDPATDNTFSKKMQALFKDAYSQTSTQFVPGLMGPNQWAKIPGEVLKSLLKELMVIANFYQLANPDWDRAACDKAAYIYYCRERLPFLETILKGQKGQLANPVSAGDIPKILSGKKANVTMVENKQFTDLAIVNQAALPSDLDSNSMWSAAHAAAILPPTFTGTEDLSMGDLHAPPLGILELNKKYNPELFDYEPTK